MRRSGQGWGVANLAQCHAMCCATGGPDHGSKLCVCELLLLTALTLGVYPADEELVTEDVGVAVLADAFVVRCATIGATGSAPSRRRAKFTPSSVDVFAWPMDQYGLCDR